MTDEITFNRKTKALTQPPDSPLMTQEEFIHIIKEKGWTQLELAVRWGYTSGRDIRRLAQNIERLPRYADAVRGLPYLVKAR